MTAKNQDFMVYSGDYKRIEFTAKDFEPTSVEDIKWFGCDELSKSLSDMDLTADTIKLVLTPAETRELPLGSYEHELKIEEAGQVKTVSKGTYYIEKPKSETM